MEVRAIFYGAGWGNATPTRKLWALCEKAEHMKKRLEKRGIPAEIETLTNHCGGEVYTFGRFDLEFLPEGTHEPEGAWGIISGDRVFVGVAFTAGYLGSGLDSGVVYLTIVGEADGPNIKVKKVSIAQAFSCTIGNVVRRELEALAQKAVADRV